ERSQIDSHKPFCGCCLTKSGSGLQIRHPRFESGRGLFPITWYHPSRRLRFVCLISKTEGRLKCKGRDRSPTFSRTSAASTRVRARRGVISRPASNEARANISASCAGRRPKKRALAVPCRSSRKKQPGKPTRRRFCSRTELPSRL